MVFFRRFYLQKLALEIATASHTIHKGIVENIGHLKIVRHEWKVPFSQYKFRILLCLKDLRGTGDTSRNLLKVSQTKKCQSGFRKSYRISASSVGLEYLVSGKISHLINSWDAIRDISDEPQWIPNFD